MAQATVEKTIDATVKPAQPPHTFSLAAGINPSDRKDRKKLTPGGRRTEGGRRTRGWDMGRGTIGCNND